MDGGRDRSAGSLVERCRLGDQQAWRELVTLHSRYVHAIARHAYRLSDADAEDVFQETFARVFESLETLRDDDALAGWIGQIARNLCVDQLRRKRGADLVGEEWLEAVAAPSRDVDRALAVDRAMSALSARCAEVLDRFFRRDEPYQMIAAALGIPAGTIASRISRCLAQLRLELEGKNPASPPSDWI